jgi:hypothetical protein
LRCLGHQELFSFAGRPELTAVHCPLAIFPISFRMHTYEKSACNSFGMHTCGAKDLKSPGMNTYKKGGGGVGPPFARHSLALSEAEASLAIRHYTS